MVAHRLSLCLAIGLLVAPNAFAKCPVGQATIFSCSTAKGKTIEVCDAGKTIGYTFGSAQAKPEIALNVPRNKVTTYQWNGIGRYLSYAVDITNDSANSKTTYSVFHGMDRIAKEHAIEAGVNVLVDGKLLATVRCSGKNIINNIEGVDLAPTP